MRKKLLAAPLVVVAVLVVTLALLTSKKSEYFFIRESEFIEPLGDSIFWDYEKWQWSDSPYNSIVIDSGVLRLRNNETAGVFSVSGVYQGNHVDGRRSHNLFVGFSGTEGEYREYVEFPSVEEGKFWLAVRFRINEMGFSRFPDESLVELGYANDSMVDIGFSMMCSINDEPYDWRTALWINCIFTDFRNSTHVWTIPEGTSYSHKSPLHGELHSSFWVEELSIDDLGEWITVQIDLGEVISKAMESFTEVRKVRVHGIMVGVECLGAYAEVEYDYVRTYRT